MLKSYAEDSPNPESVTETARFCSDCYLHPQACLLAEGLSDSYLGRELRPGGLAGGHLYDGARERPDVCHAPMASLLDDLRSHPV